MREKGIAELAARQYGVVTRRQLLASGVSPAAVGRRVEAGRLWPVHRGVYAVGRPDVSRAGYLLAAVLACGAGAALSHAAAAEWWRLTGRRAAPIEVTVPAAGGRRARGVVVHRSAHLTGHATRHRGIPVTTPERTMVDLAGSSTRRKMERLLDEAQRLRLYDRDRLDHALTAGLAGTALLRAVLERHEPGSTWTRNDFEEAFLGLLDDAKLPRPTMNHEVGPYVLDCLWADAGLAVELDGRGSHLTPRAFEGDRDRDSYLYAEHGVVTLRFTYRQITETPGVVAHRVRRARAPSRSPAARARPAGYPGAPGPRGRGAARPR
jgi:very-short-patch-repair endonuclease